MNRGWVIVAAVALLVAAILRFEVLLHQPSLANDLSPVRSQVIAWICAVSADQDVAGDPNGPSVESLRSLGVTAIEFERFDPDALVVMRPGGDGQPGVAGVDDNGNGIVDDASELGATRSDDVCVVRPAAEFENGPHALVLQRGAFVPATSTVLATSAVLAGGKPGEPLPWRAFVLGNSDGESWSFLIDAKATAKN